MQVGIIGAGFVGLPAALRLARAGHEVFVFEKEEKPGGLAIGFRAEKWRWPAEKHYHHLFVSDWSIRKLADEVDHAIIFKRPKTSLYVKGAIYQLDSPISLLAFPYLSWLDRFRTGATLAYLKLSPLWKLLEGTTAQSFLIRTMGQKSWEVLWQPLFEGKFHEFSSGVPASWFWARIKKRSASLGYPERGFESLAKKIQKAAEAGGVKFFLGTGIANIKKQKGGLILTTDKGAKFQFDRVISTLPSPIFCKITQNLPERFKRNLLLLKGLGAVNLVLALKRQFLTDGTYWLNVNDVSFPFLGVMEQTNFIDKKFYGGDRIIYVGNYLPASHPYFTKGADELIKEFLPFLRRINPNFKRSWIRKSWLFKAPFAQPVIPLNYSKILPPFKTPIAGLYSANIQQVYPWDRGTNYAVELGEKVANEILKK